MKPLLSVTELRARLDAREPDLVVVDTRFSLADPAAGRRAYQEAHAPGAFFLDLEEDLSGDVVPGVTGRHPLPPLEDLVEKLGALGVAPGCSLVVYDDGPGAFAARLWWLARYVGLEQVQVLDGGWAAWKSAGYEVTAELPTPSPRSFSLGVVRSELIAGAGEVEVLRQRGDARIFDARAADRFRGENETIDPVAGHIPGARSLPFVDNLEGGRFKSAEALRERFRVALGDVPPERAVVYCGSGVTACHDLLAAEHAGLTGMRLYPGSWSEWIASGKRPIAIGE